MHQEWTGLAVVLTIVRWSIRLWALWAVPRHRTPNAARAWLLLVLLEPFGGALLYSLFGRAYVPRVRRERLAVAAAMIRSWPEMTAAARAPVELRPELGATSALAQALGAFPVVGGNGVEVVDGYEDFLDRLVADADAARGSIHLLFYIFEPDASGRRVADALARAARRGVACRVMVDGLASRPMLRSVAPELRAAGVEVLAAFPPGVRGLRRDLRNHRKIAVVDGAVGYTGSQNLVDAFGYKGRGLTYEDLMVRLTGPVVHQLQAIFLADRYMETGTTLAEAGHFPPPPEGGTVLAQALASGPTFPVANNRRTFVQLIAGARRRVVVTSPYFVPDEPFLEAMLTAAARGVEVHLVTPRQMDQWLVRLAQESFYSNLLDEGVAIHLYRSRFLHAKHITVDDDVVAVGSSNVDQRSFSLNGEDMVFLYDRQACAAVGRVQERYFRDSDLLTREAWAERTWNRVFAQRMARMVDSLL